MLEKVKEIIEKEIKPALAMDGGSVELLNVEDGTVKVRLSGSCAGCPMSQYTVKNFVESTIKRQIPEVKEVVAVDDLRDKFGARRIC